jgi:sigma-B regulation protein RsbU (phosphoserine phosphatase)
VEPRTPRLALAGAGHPPPVLSRRGRVGRIECPSGLPILMMPMPEPETAACELRAGDRMLFYTDGITERLGPGDSMYEEERLRCAFARAASQAADAIVPRIVADVDAFAAGVEAHDDQTLLLVAIE